MIKIEKAPYQGLIIPELKIGLDLSYADCDTLFVSHGHADHMPKKVYSSVYATAPTAAFLRARGYSVSISILDFREEVTLENGAKVQFFEAGHILGSAMIYIQHNGESILYTGDFKNPPSAVTEGFNLPAKVDQFITEATFSLPIYKWKKKEDLFKQICSFAQNALDDAYTPIFLAYNLGKAQEILFALKDLSTPKMIHGAGYNMAMIYQDFGIDLGEVVSYKREEAEGCILVCPSSALSKGFASHIKKIRTAYVSGWASVEARRAQFKVDELIPLSDHIDYFGLIDICKQLRPKKVWITHTPNPDVVMHTLALEGIDAGFIDVDKDELEDE